VDSGLIDHRADKIVLLVTFQIPIDRDQDPDDRNGNAHEFGEPVISRFMHGMVDMLRAIHRFSGMLRHNAEPRRESFPIEFQSQ
jgi:hypothetical protein